MPLHTTDDPVKRAEHVADKASKDFETWRWEQGIMPYTDWPKYWLEFFYSTLGDFTELEEV